LPKSRRVVLAILLLCIGSFSEAARICESPIYGGITVHTFVRMKYDCSTPGASCSQKLPFTNWGSIGFEKKGGGLWGAGQLRDDSGLSCKSWQSGHVGRVAEAASAAQERKAISDLADSWKDAGYGLHAGLAGKGCDPKTSRFSPSSGNGNVCWGFTCAYVSYLYQKLNVKPAAIDSGFSVRNLADVPSTWTCKPEQYGSGDGCQCTCGTFDPDCDPMTAVSLDCPNRGDICIPGPKDEPICSSRHEVLSERKQLQILKGTPIYAPYFLFTNDTADVDAGGPWGNYGPAFTRSDVPSSWTCNTLFYGSNDGCDCACGAWDPDCGTSAGSAQKVFNCDTDNSEVQCAMSKTTPSQPVCLYDLMARDAAVQAGFPSPSVDSSRLPTNVVIAASVGSTLGAVVLLAGITYFIRRRNKQRARAAVNLDQSMQAALL